MAEKATRTRAEKKTNEPGTTIVSQHWINRDGDGAQREEAEKRDGTGAKDVREAHFTATEDGTTAPAHDKLVPKR
ncbi:MAG: hypothetical protein FD152_2579 [Xanthobacteraceae bacterium]|nr:MAG: hypothetical protein FD152_2579 [Xanthobacteraceae bacterium]